MGSELGRRTGSTQSTVTSRGGGGSLVRGTDWDSVEAVALVMERRHSLASARNRDLGRGTGMVGRRGGKWTSVRKRTSSLEGLTGHSGQSTLTATSTPAILMSTPGNVVHPVKEDKLSSGTCTPPRTCPSPPPPPRTSPGRSAMGSEYARGGIRLASSTPSSIPVHYKDRSSPPKGLNKENDINIIR